MLEREVAYKFLLRFQESFMFSMISAYRSALEANSRLEHYNFVAPLSPRFAPLCE